jgi:hypothetical protein
MASYQQKASIMNVASRASEEGEANAKKTH